MTERWLPVVGWERLYEVSDVGRVRSKRLGRILNPRTMGSYLAVGLTDGPVSVNKRVHRLVGEAFLGPRPADYETRHLDGNPHNNALSNLAYGTRVENARDKARHGGHYQSRRAECPRGHSYLDLTNLYVRPDGSRICRTCQAEARKRWLAKAAS